MSVADPDREIGRIFHLARQVAVEHRSAFLSEVSDKAVREEVRQLLEAGAEAEHERFLAEPVLGNKLRLASFLELPARRPVERVGPYKVLSILGEGGFATVYLAEHEGKPGEQVAVKVLRQGFETRRSLSRLEMESQALSMLEHPGIARMLHAGITEDKQPYFVMEHVAGRPLTVYCRDQRLSLRARVALMIDVCRAVDHAHKSGVIHRDLKPSNILVSEQDGQPRAKIIDFGVAKIVEGRLPHRMKTTTHGQLIGTLDYMSPEQCGAVPGAVDTRTDVYALGVVLFELLTGRVPHDLSDRPLPEAMRIIADRPAPAVSYFNRRLRGDLDTIVAHALNKDREHRYQGARELADDLQRFLADQAILARGPNAVYHVRKFARRHKATALATIAVVLVLFAMLVQGMVGWRESRIRYLEARNLAEFLLNDVVTEMAHTAGKAKMRRNTLQQVLDRAERFLRAGHDDLRLQLLYARALSQLGDLHREQGDVPRAQEMQGRALEIHQRLAASHPEQAALHERLSINLVKVGDLWRESGLAQRAAPLYFRALEIDERLAFSHPGNLTFQDNLAWSYERCASLSAELNDPASAVRYSQLRRGKVMELSQAAADDERVLHNMVAMHSIAADAAAREGNAEGVLEHRQEALRHAERLVARHGGNRLYHMRLASALASLGGVHHDRGEGVQAQRLMARAINTARHLSQGDADHLDAQSILVHVLLSWSEMCMADGDLASAVEALDEAEPIASAIAAAKPTDPSFQSLARDARARLEQARRLDETRREAVMELEATNR